MSFTKNLGRFEDDMRTLREKRTQPGWSFCEYFMVQVPNKRKNRIVDLDFVRYCIQQGGSRWCVLTETYLTEKT